MRFCFGMAITMIEDNVGGPRRSRWLAGLKFASPVQQIVFQEYIEAVKQATGRVAGLEHEMAQALQTWELVPVVKALMALRVVKLLTAMTVLAELGDLSRLTSPSPLMAYLVSERKRHLPYLTRGFSVFRW